MISDTERRAAAARLRQFLSEPWNERSWYHDSLQNVGSLVGTSVGENILARLADLIDRPTCKKEEHDEYYWRCTRCGGFICWDAVTDCCGVIPTRYCPNCGAEVVE